jgi:citrate synthase
MSRLPTVRHRPPAQEIDALTDAVRALLAALDRRRVDLSQLHADPAVQRVIATMTALELTAESWRRHADARWLASRMRVGEEILRQIHPELAKDAARAIEIIVSVSLCR